VVPHVRICGGSARRLAGLPDPSLPLGCPMRTAVILAIASLVACTPAAPTPHGT
jgi:hypothetical protein